MGLPCKSRGDWSFVEVLLKRIFGREKVGKFVEK
jgi:hypothetical protein